MMRATLKGALGVGALLLGGGPAWADDYEGQAQARMKRMDADANGSISLAEFTEFRRSWTSKRADAETQMQPDVVQRAFDKIDRNGDGAISFAELLRNTKETRAGK